MAIKVRSLDALARLVNVYEGIKLALLREGRIPASSPTRVSEVAASDKAKLKAKTAANKKSADDKSHQDPSQPTPKQTKPAEKGEKESEKLKSVAKKAHEILFKLDTVFPFTLFPDTVTVEREKVSIAKRHFFRMAKITHIPVRDLLHVDSQVGPFFGSVHITSRYFSDKPFTVNYLWREDSLKLQRLLQGYIIAHEREIDCTDISKDKLIDILNDLGGGDTK